MEKNRENDLYLDEEEDNKSDSSVTNDVTENTEQTTNSEGSKNTRVTVRKVEIVVIVSVISVLLIVITGLSVWVCIDSERVQNSAQMKCFNDTVATLNTQIEQLDDKIAALEERQTNLSCSCNCTQVQIECKVALKEDSKLRENLTMLREVHQMDIAELKHEVSYIWDNLTAINNNSAVQDEAILSAIDDFRSDVAQNISNIREEQANITDQLSSQTNQIKEKVSDLETAQHTLETDNARQDESIVILEVQQTSHNNQLISYGQRIHSLETRSSNARGIQTTGVSTSLTLCLITIAFFCSYL